MTTPGRFHGVGKILRADGHPLARNVSATLESKQAMSLESAVVCSPIVAAPVADVSALPGRAIRFLACVLEPAEFTTRHSCAQLLAHGHEIHDKEGPGFELLDEAV